MGDSKYQINKLTQPMQKKIVTQQNADQSNKQEQHKHIFKQLQSFNQNLPKIYYQPEQKFCINILKLTIITAILGVFLASYFSMNRMKQFPNQFINEVNRKTPWQITSLRDRYKLSQKNDNFKNSLINPQANSDQEIQKIELVKHKTVKRRQVNPTVQISYANQHDPKNFPIQTRPSPLPLGPFQIQEMKKCRISRQSSTIAKNYIRLGLNQPPLKLIQQEKIYYQKKYRLEQTFKNKLQSLQFPFCIVIASYNNVKNNRYQFTLNSLFRQEYKNFHIVYVDDASPDQTGKMVIQHVKTKNFNDSKINVIINKQNKGPVANQYLSAKQYCKQNEIIMIIDGDDGLVGTQTLKLFNHFYQTENVWFAYGNYMKTISNEDIGVSQDLDEKVKKERSYRYQQPLYWMTSHPKTFYSNLVKRMSISNLLQVDQNKQPKGFFRVNADRGIVYPIVEMSGTRIKYIPEILYLYIDQTDYSEGKKNDQQGRVLNIIQKMPREQYLPCLFSQKYFRFTDQVQQSHCLQARQTIRRNLTNFKL